MYGAECITLERHSMIRVEAHGFGNFPALPRYLDALRANNSVAVTNLVEAFEDCPFRYNADASIRMLFTTPDKGIKIFNSTWAPLQQWRRTNAVLILIDGSVTAMDTESDQRSITEAVATIAGKYPADAVCRCVVIAPSERGVAFVHTLPNFLMFSNHPTDVSSIVKELALDLVRHFKKRIQTVNAMPEKFCMKPVRDCAEISTALDPKEDNDSRAQRLDKMESRACKVQGDMCLMMGSYLDAKRLYERPQVKSGDPFWQAAALEATACVYYHLNKSEESKKTSSKKMKEITDLLIESGNIYSTRTGVIQLEAEVLLELAQLRIVEQGLPLEGFKQISKAVGVAAKIREKDGTARKEGAEICRSAATLCALHGWHRKASFYSERGGCIDTEVGKNKLLALQQLVVAVQFSGTPLTITPNGHFAMLPKKTVALPCAWPRMMRFLLGSLLRIIETTSMEKAMLSQLCIYMLSIDTVDGTSDVAEGQEWVHVAEEDALEQAECRQLKLQATLQTASEAFPHDAQLCIAPLRFLQGIRKVDMAPDRRPCTAPDPTKARWEFNPLIKAEPFEEFIAGMVCCVEVVLENPFLFPLELTEVKLIAEGVPHSAMALSSVRILRQNMVSVRLHIQPYVEGVIHITAVQVKWRSTHSYPLRLLLAKALEVDVLPAISVLTIEAPPQRHLCLFPSQIETTDLLLHNVGDIPIQKFHVEIHSSSCTLASCSGCHHSTLVKLGDNQISQEPFLASQCLRVPLRLAAAQQHTPTEPTESVEIRVFYGREDVITLTTRPQAYYYCQRRATLTVPLQLLPGLGVKSVCLSLCARNLMVVVGNASGVSHFQVEQSKHYIRPGAEETLTLPISRQEKGLLPVPWEGDARRVGCMLIALPNEIRTTLADELDRVTVRTSPSVLEGRTLVDIHIQIVVDNTHSKYGVRCGVHFAMPRASPHAVEGHVMWQGPSLYTVDRGITEENFLDAKFLTAGEYYLVVEIHSNVRRIAHCFTINVTEE